MANPNQHPNQQHQQNQKPSVTTTPPSQVSVSEPEIATHNSAIPAQIEVSVQKAGDKLVKIKPRITIAKMRVGTKWMQFVKGKETIVSASMIPHLEEKGII